MPRRDSALANDEGRIWRQVRFGACAGFVFVLVFNVWTVGRFLSADGRIEWPHTLHVWLIQGTVFLCSALGLAAFIRRTWLKDTLQSLTPASRAAGLLLVLLGIDGFLGLAFWLTQRHPGFSDWGYLHFLFHLDREFNIPALYAVAQLWLAAALAFVCSRRTRPNGGDRVGARAAWMWASAILILLGFDELLSIHENAERLLVAAGLLGPDYDNRLGGYGYAWTVVGIPVALAFSAWFTWRFYTVFRYDRRLLGLLVLSGVAFFSGSIVLENLQVYVTDLHQLERSPRLLLLCEELLEMLGVSLAIYVFLRHAQNLEAAPVAPSPGGWR